MWKSFPQKDISCLSHWSSCGCGGTLMVGLRLLGQRNDGPLRRRTSTFCVEAEKRRRPCIKLKDRRQRHRVLPPTANTFAEHVAIKPRHQQGAGEADRRMLSTEGSPSQSQKKIKKNQQSRAIARSGNLTCPAWRMNFLADFHLTFKERVDSHKELHDGNRAQQTQTTHDKKANKNTLRGSKNVLEISRHIQLLVKLKV